MLQVIAENSPKTVWTGSPLEAFRSVQNTNRGDIGEEFLVRYLTKAGVTIAKNSARNLEWDVRVFGKTFEVKTASQDSGGGFQFNHVRLDRKYDFLLCLAVRPNQILAQFWSKGEVAEGKAGTAAGRRGARGLGHQLHLAPPP